MTLFLLRVLLTFFVILCLYWGAIELLWEEDRVSDEWHDFVQEVGEKSMAILFVGGIVAVGLMLIWFLWKGV